MRAVVIQQFGEPSQLKLLEVPTPQPGPDEVLVAVTAAAINPSDVKNVQGAMHGTTLPRIPGRDFAGVIVRGARDIGREVWGTGGDIGFTRDGSHAEFILLPAAAIVPKPVPLSMEAAGSAGLTFVTAWLAMVSSAAVAAGDVALIIGAAGGVGSAAAQIAKSRGAKVIGVVRSNEEIPGAQSAGADEVINSKSANLLEAVKALTDNRGADIAFDITGMLFAEAVEAAAMDGRIPVITAPADGKATFNLRNFYRKQLRVYGIDTRPLDVVASAKLLAEISPGFEAGNFTVKPGKTFPLTAAVEAYEQAARGGARITLRPDL